MQLSNIKVIPHYGDRVSVVPVVWESASLREASREQLAVLIALMAQPETSYLSLSERTGATRAQIEDAIAYWQNAGVLSEAQVTREAEAAPQAEKDTKPHLDRAAQLPHYNTAETASFLSAHPSATGLIDCCQQELGKIFNTSETETIIGLLDYLSLDPEYILLLCAHSAKRGKKSLRYIEKTAISYHDEGILTYEQLEEHSAERALRDMFGIGKRALTKKEREAFFSWTAEWEMPMDVISHAYEIAVGRTNEPSVPYTNAILQKWHTEGLATLADVEKFETARRPGGKCSSSFETDDFFEAALQRSYGEK